MAILILVHRFSRAKDISEKTQILNFYIKNIDRVNNWDLVDLSAHKIIGKSISLGIISDEILYKYSNSQNLWLKRIAIISTFDFIAYKKFDITLEIAKILLKDKHDLIHKAIGWVLREIWKKDPAVCEEFILKNYSSLPRTSLRYAIEKMEESKRKRFLKGSFP